MEQTQQADTMPPDWMIIGATRYAMGRMTYIVQDTCTWLVHNWDKLPDSVRSVIVRDLEAEFERDDRARKTNADMMVLPLGWDCDRAQWDRVRALYKAEPAQKPKTGLAQ